MRIRWSLDAADDLEEIWENLHTHRPKFAQSTIVRMYADLMNLRRFPMMGRASERRKGCRELVLRPFPYVCTYQVDENAVYILHIRYETQEHIADVQ